MDIESIAGGTKVPARHVGLLAFLEDAVHPVTPPHRGGVFHPKLWLLRFAPQEPDDPVAYRLLVLSRNLTFDRSWDTALMLDGELLDSQRGLPINQPLSMFVAALPGMALAAGTQLNERARQRADRLGDEVRRVEWWLPDGFDTLTFHPIGHDGRPAWPFEDLRRLLVLSPFVGPKALATLREQVREDLTVVGRFDELSKLDPALVDRFNEVEVFDDAATLLDVDNESGVPDEVNRVELTGLHAKVYVGERGKRAAVYVGSANATRGAFDINVEFLVELEGSRKQHGIDTVRDALRAAGLLTPFMRGDVAVDDPDASSERALEQAAHDLAIGLRARFEPAGADRWRPMLELARPVALGDFSVQARPLAEPTLRTVDLGASPCCTFAPAGLSSISAFFHLRISSADRHRDVTVRLPLEDAPEGRIAAVTAELLSDRERLLRFILLLLSEDADGDRMLDELEGLLAERTAGSAGVGEPQALAFRCSSRCCAHFIVILNASRRSIVSWKTFGRPAAMSATCCRPNSRISGRPSASCARRAHDRAVRPRAGALRPQGLPARHRRSRVPPPL